jgi:hypothetical protein
MRRDRRKCAPEHGGTEPAVVEAEEAVVGEEAEAEEVVAEHPAPMPVALQQ